jgi:hypothetical protein
MCLMVAASATGIDSVWKKSAGKFVKQKREAKAKGTNFAERKCRYWGNFIT